MRKIQQLQPDNHDIKHLPLPELRQKWAVAWGVPPHAKIGRAMLAKSLEYKLREQEQGGLEPELQERLKKFISTYKRNPRCFDDNVQRLKPGTRLVKIWKEKRHSVLVLANGFEYEDRIYSSLSEIATTITGSRWNGWVFFGVKKHRRHTEAADESAS
jgi:hypothetical protein